MSDKAFPKRRNTDVTAEVGVNLVSTIVNDEFGWIFRRTHQEHDFGVDGYIDYVNSVGGVTGKFLAVQIKTGKSYLSKAGAVHWYTDTKEHLNYFLNLPTPIILIICDPESKECFWAELKKEEVDFKGETWRYPIPKSEILAKKSFNKIRKVFGSSEDHIAEFEEDNEFMNLAESSSFIQYSVPREDIESRNIKNLKSFLSRITRNKKLTLAVQGKLYICTYGYEGDDREVFQIKDVRKWAKKARKKIDYWYLCASGGDIPSTISWMAACTTNIEAEFIVQPNGRPGYQIEGMPKEWSEFMMECFNGLNEASDKWGWPTRLNYEISQLIQKELFPDIPFPELEENT
jgi:hypothetical protein